MTKQIDIRCPKCGLPMRLQLPGVKSELKCPKCSNSMVLDSNGTFTSLPRLHEFSSLPAPVVLSTAPPTPIQLEKPVVSAPTAVKRLDASVLYPSTSPEKYSTRRPNPGHRSAQSSNMKGPLIGVACLAFSLALGLAIYAFLDRDRFADTFNRSDTLATETHQELLADYLTLVGEAMATVQGIEGSRSKSAAMPKLSGLIDEFYQCSDRAGELLQLSSEQRLSVSKQLDVSIPQKTVAVFDAIEELQRQTDLMDETLSERLAALKTSMKFTAGTFHAAWMKIPEPLNPTQEIEAEIIALYRTVWSRTHTVASNEDYEALGDLCRHSIEQLDAILQRYGRLREKEQLFRVFSPYFQHRQVLIAGISERLDLWEGEYGAHEDAIWLDRFFAADKKLTNTEG